MKERPDLLNGIPFTFTTEEERTLRIATKHMHHVLQDRAEGWRIEYVANLQLCNRLVWGAINRGRTTPEFGRSQRPPS